MTTATDPTILEKANAWLSETYDADTRAEVQRLIDAGGEPLIEAFYKDLEFGTGGLRGIMGVGTNRINRYTVGMATQGLCNHLNDLYKGEPISLAVAHDSRNNSPEFARVVAEIASANGIKAYLFEALRPTPELSFAVRELGCKAGVVITASHNPPEYNGYKVYWNDGGQLVPPHDKNVINEVRNVNGAADVRFTPSTDLIEVVGQDMDDRYLERVASLSLNDAAVNASLSVVYTPLHGTGVVSIPPAMAKMGFEQVHVLEAQATPDGNFPTVKSPNPEETAALALAIEKANELNADVVLGTDPDTDRVGMVARDHHGELRILNGNQAGSLLVYFLLARWQEQGRLDGKQFVAKTVVTTELIQDIANHFGVKCEDTLTGFKYIAERIRLNEGQYQFVGGGEESYGYLAGDFVRDKDAVISAVLLSEIAAWAKVKGQSVFDTLIDLYVQFGCYQERLISITRKGRSGAEEIAQMMTDLRTSPPKTVAGSKVVKITDHQSQQTTDLTTGTSVSTGLPSSNVYQFFLEDGSKITARPSGTEPKIKFYFSLRADLDDRANYDAVRDQLEARIDAIVAELNLMA